MSDEDQRKALEYEQWFASVSKVRKPQTRSSWWESAALISSVTAVLTVALTSIAGYHSQRLLRDNEDALRKRDRAYEQDVAVLQASHSLATESAHYATERSRIATGMYSGLSAAQIRTLIDSVNAADTRWRQGREIQRVGLELGFGERSSVLVAWDTLVHRLDAFATCTVVGPQTLCGAMRSPVDSALVVFRHLAVRTIRTGGTD